MFKMRGVWEQKYHTFAKKIMVVDDLADRTHDCDSLLLKILLEKS